MVREMKDNTSTEMSILFKAAKILRREYLKVENKFLGSFTKAENESVPLALMSFLTTLLHGPNIKEPQTEAEKTKITTSIAQQIMFNPVGRWSQKCESIPRHIKERETPASLYIAMKVFLQSGRENLS